MPEQGGGKGFGRLPFNYRGQRARLGERPCCTIQRCPASVSVLDTRSGPGGRTPAGLLHMYYMRLCSEKLLADIRGLCSPFSPSSSANLRSDNVPPLSSENSTRVTLHLARVHRLAALVSRADDIVYPPFFLFSFRPPFVPPSYSTASPSPLFDSSPRLVSSSYRFRFATKGRRSGAAVHLAPRDRATSVDTSTANSTRDGFFDDWNGKQRRTIPSEIGKEMETWIDVTINLSDRDQVLTIHFSSSIFD